MADWTLGPATPADVPAIMSVIAECFSPTWRSIVVYGAPGACHYAADLIRRQEAGGDTAFIVARDSEGRILGFVEVRRLGGAVHLNNMATTAMARGQGIYAALMAEALRLGRLDGYRRASLDVFVDNPIRAFLLRCGYRVTSAVTWQAAALPAGPRPIGVYFGGLPHADAAHARFGFSELTILTGRGARYGAGRLDQRWFRVTDPAAVADRDALVALHHLDPARELLAIVPLGTPFAPELTLRAVGASERLAGEIATVLPALGRRGTG